MGSGSAWPRSCRPRRSGTATGRGAARARPTGRRRSLWPIPYPPAAGQLLTVCTGAATEAEARERRALFPGAMAEDMEGFAVALACRLAEVPVAIVRGISNAVGDRRFERWQIPEALDAAHLVAADLLHRPTWSRPA